MSTTALDPFIGGLWKACQARSLPRPDVLVLLASGLDLLPERLEDGQELDLTTLEPEGEGFEPRLLGSLESARLFHGTLDGARVWIAEDTSLDPRLPGPDRDEVPPWLPLWTVWLASKAGATRMLHASAGFGLGEALPAGSLALLRDHIHFGGASPLHGLGESELGPLFPDTTHLHDAHARELARRVAEARGLDTREAIAACVPAPNLDTPAECEFYRRAGCELVVQGLAAPLLAAAHAGLSVLATSAVLDTPKSGLDVRGLLERAERVAPALEELVVLVCGELNRSGALEE